MGPSPDASRREEENRAGTAQRPWHGTIAWRRPQGQRQAWDWPPGADIPEAQEVWEIWRGDFPYTWCERKMLRPGAHGEHPAPPLKSAARLSQDRNGIPEHGSQTRVRSRSIEWIDDS